jgi:hypothetical protein
MVLMVVSVIVAQSQGLEFPVWYTKAADRKKLWTFMDAIPNGYYVAVRNIMYNSEAGQFIDKWKEDESLYGTGNTLYHKLKMLDLVIWIPFINQGLSPSCIKKGEWICAYFCLFQRMNLM